LNNIQKEIIIVNDCSTDKSKEIIYDYIKSNKQISISLIEHEKNMGKGAALHTGINATLGDILINHEKHERF